MSAELVLPARLDLPAAVPLAEAILAHRGQDLNLIAQDVLHLGTPCLQVLLAAAKSWRTDGRSLALASPSGAMIKQLDCFGLTLDDMSHSAAEV